MLNCKSHLCQVFHYKTVSNDAPGICLNLQSNRVKIWSHMWCDSFQTTINALNHVTSFQSSQLSQSSTHNWLCTVFSSLAKDIFQYHDMAMTIHSFIASAKLPWVQNHLQSKPILTTLAKLYKNNTNECIERKFSNRTMWKFFMIQCHEYTKNKEISIASWNAKSLYFIFCEIINKNLSW